MTKNLKGKDMICDYCGKLIDVTDRFEYIRTKRKTEIFLHTKCIKDIWATGSLSNNQTK